MKNNMYITVIKRDGTEEEFDIEKIQTAVAKAFESVGKEVPNAFVRTIDDIFSNISVDEVQVEEIQDMVESALISWHFQTVAKSYILYRNKHKELREAAKKKWDFVHKFVNSDNAANATIDDNSNVGTKSIGVLNAEIHKEDNKNTNLFIWKKEMNKLYPDFPLKQMEEDFSTILYVHDFSSQVLMPYCLAVSMYPFLLNGLKDLGGKSAVPKNIDSFCGIFVNLVFALASEVKGAVATPEFLMYMDYFCRKEWGEDYYKNYDAVISGDICQRKKTVGDQIDQYFQQVTYSINQIAGSRGMQSPFTNFSFFDKYFFEGMFGEFKFPDGTAPQWESTNWLQQRYLHWLNQERLKCMLTFPVCSYACLIKDGEFIDRGTYHFICKEYAEGNSFFLYTSSSVDSLSSCCRLSSSISENSFNFTNGQIGVMTGSKQVITLDLNRIIQDWVKQLRKLDVDTGDLIPYNIEDIRENIDGDVVWIREQVFNNPEEGFEQYLIKILERVYKYHTAYNSMLHWAYEHNLFPAYKAGFINLDKQYLTIGINGLNQAAEFLGIECNNNEKYKEFCKSVFGIIKKQNELHRTAKERYNTEQVPAESAAIKLYERDKKDGYWIPEDTNLYASYIFKPNDPNISVLDKITLHSSQFAADQLDGGSACHLNLDSHLSVPQYAKLLDFAAKVGCKYLTFNVPNSECENCGYITKVPIIECPRCHSNNIAYWDRIIG